MSIQLRTHLGLITSAFVLLFTSSSLASATCVDYTVTMSDVSTAHTTSVIIPRFARN